MRISGSTFLLIWIKSDHQKRVFTSLPVSPPNSNEYANHRKSDMDMIPARDGMENILGMRIIWDAPIEMDDGVVLRADIFLPQMDGRYPVIITHGPYGKGLPFQDAWSSRSMNARLADGRADHRKNSPGEYLSQI